MLRKTFLVATITIFFVAFTQNVLAGRNDITSPISNESHGHIVAQLDPLQSLPEPAKPDPAQQENKVRGSQPIITPPKGKKQGGSALGAPGDPNPFPGQSGSKPSPSPDLGQSIGPMPGKGPVPGTQPNLTPPPQHPGPGTAPPKVPGNPGG